MNLSLLIIVVMLAIVIPALARLFFFQEKAPQTFLEPVMASDKREAQPIPEATPKITHSEILDSSLLLDIAVEHKPKPQQKNLLSENLKIFATPGCYFRSYELLQALYDVGLTYGEKNLFHFVEEGEILFSVAPTALPHVFFLDEIGSFSTEGLEFILKNEKAATLMYETAGKLSEALGARTT